MDRPIPPIPEGSASRRAVSSVSPTREMSCDYWLVIVREPRSDEEGLVGYEHRFEFHGESSAVDAWACWAKAVKNGFEAVAEPVREYPS